jgi:2-hydroxychromene-2-carboxylate isomerase
MASASRFGRVNIMPDRRLEFWFEYGSTYTYLTVARITRAAADRVVHVDWRPFLLMPILIEQGLANGPFLPYPNKLRYMWRDLERRALRYSIPYQKPSVYPPNTLLTARIGYLAQSQNWCWFHSRSLPPSLDRGHHHRN